MDGTRLSLRILYTINSSPQYILARSSSPVPVYSIPTSLKPNFQCAYVSLKTCLDTICCSSPELVQDLARDFSVYVLDPLESNSPATPVSILSATLDPSSSKANAATSEPSRGVAVGLGLMSWALREDEEEGCTVTGTLIKLGTGQTALEVIFALRETATMQKGSLPAAIRSWGLPRQSSKSGHFTSSSSNRAVTGSAKPPASSALSSLSQSHQQATDVATRATIASIQMRTQHKRPKPKKLAKPPSTTTPQSEADRLMLAEDIYIGPVKKKGRPTRPPNTANTEPSVIDASHRTTRKPSKSPALLPDYPSFIPNPNTHKQEPDPTTPNHPISPESDTILDILSHLSTSSSSANPTAALLAAFSAIDSTSTASESATTDKPPRAALLTALKDLLAAIAQQGASPSNDSQNSAPHLCRSQSLDDEVVLLDKENINPTAFRRRGGKNGNVIGDSSHPSPVRVSLGSTLSNTPPTVEASETAPYPRSLSVCTNASPNTTQHPANKASARSSRKRTLSDFMDERETQRKKEKVKAKESTDPSWSRHYPRVITSDYTQKRTGTNSYYRTALEPWTSPVKPTMNHTRSASSQECPSHKENSREKPIIIPESPQACRVAASSPVRSKSSQPRRPYVIPEWARTHTTTQPRLSQEARALEGNGGGKEKQGKDMGRAGATTRAGREKRTRIARNQSKEVAKASKPPQPIAAMNGCAVFAVTVSSEDQASNSMPSTPPHRPLPWPIAVHANVLCTPPRKHSEALFSPVGDASLFTPLPELYGPNPRHHIRSPPQKFLVQLSPRTPCRTGSTPSLTTKGRSSANTSPKHSGTKLEGNDTDGEDLSRELDSALEGLDLPLSKTYGNINADEAMPSPPRPSDESEYGAEPTMQQHWIGLPPSSPPAPSSPLLMPQEEESDFEDRELPIATSEAEDCPREAEPASSSVPGLLTLPSCTEAEIAEFFSDQDFDLLFPDISQTPLNSDSTNFRMDIFDQFINHNAQSEGTQSTDFMPADMFPSVGDLDFTEFWETFKPLVEQNTQSLNSGGSPANSTGLDFGQLEDGRGVGMSEDLSPTKLAEDVQALFSGCLL